MSGSAVHIAADGHLPEWSQASIVKQGLPQDERIWRARVCVCMCQCVCVCNCQREYFRVCVRAFTMIIVLTIQITWNPCKVSQKNYFFLTINAENVQGLEPARARCSNVQTQTHDSMFSSQSPILRSCARSLLFVCFPLNVSHIDICRES